MKRKIALSLLLAVCVFAQSMALIPANNRQRLNNGWQFLRGDMGGIWEVFRPAKAGQPASVPLWKSVTLPHCFNELDGVNPDVNYYEGPGWYRTVLDVENPYAGGHTFLEFDGAGQKTQVYVYTTLVGSHVGGYDEWKVDLTEAIEAFKKTDVCKEVYKGKIPVAIRCDNTRDLQMIPSDMSDFNIYGGLYRYVSLVYTPKTHIEQVKIVPTVDEKGKNGAAEITVSLADFSNSKALLKLKVKDPAGKEIYQTSAAASQGRLSFSFEQKKPSLWSPDAPQLYTCEVSLTDGAEVLTASERFGFRHIEFRENGPFFLNGKRVLLQGTHRHEDHAGLAAAMTEEMMAYEMKQIKDMGANFIRLGHYQQSSIILHLCDELGIMAWEEIPWCRGGLGNEAYKEQGRRMLRNMIAQHVNHPSIILWGMGNENDWPGDFEAAFSEANKQEIRSYMAELVNISHAEDPTRMTVIRRCDFCKDIVDVYSPSIWAGWYGRRFIDYNEMETAGMRSVPRFIHAEWGGDSHAGRHAEDQDFTKIVRGDSNGDWSETYIVHLFDWHLKEQLKLDSLTGACFWTFKDFSTPLRPNNPIPYMNQKGVVQRDNTPKESYYVFQSYWSKTPMIHIYGHSWPIRWGKADDKKEILVYSNCPEVELFVNGKSQGKKKRNTEDWPAAGFHWNVPLQEGENHIEAVATQGKIQLRDAITQQYQTATWGAPARILLKQGADERGEFVTAQVVDEKGVPCLDSREFIRWGATDMEAMLHHQGTATGSLRIQAANGRSVIRLTPGARKPVAFSAMLEKHPQVKSLITIE